MTERDHRIEVFDQVRIRLQLDDTNIASGRIWSAPVSVCHSMLKQERLSAQTWSALSTVSLQACKGFADVLGEAKQRSHIRSCMRCVMSNPIIVDEEAQNSSWPQRVPQ